MSFLNQSIVAVIPISVADTDFAGGRMPLLAGRALLEYTFRAAKESRFVDRLIVSTDSARIAEACKASGVDAPFIRPPELANPNAPITGTPWSGCVSTNASSPTGSRCCW